MPCHLCSVAALSADEKDEDEDKDEDKGEDKRGLCRTLLSS
jgi:hypothetical protein